MLYMYTPSDLDADAALDMHYIAHAALDPILESESLSTNLGSLGPIRGHQLNAFHFATGVKVIFLGESGVTYTDSSLKVLCTSVYQVYVRSLCSPFTLSLANTQSAAIDQAIMNWNDSS